MHFPGLGQLGDVLRRNLIGGRIFVVFEIAVEGVPAIVMRGADHGRRGLLLRSRRLRRGVLRARHRALSDKGTDGDCGNAGRGHCPGLLRLNETGNETNRGDDHGGHDEIGLEHIRRKSRAHDVQCDEDDEQRTKPSRHRQGCDGQECGDHQRRRNDDEARAGGAVNSIAPPEVIENRECKGNDGAGADQPCSKAWTPALP